MGHPGPPGVNGTKGERGAMGSQGPVGANFSSCTYHTDTSKAKKRIINSVYVDEKTVSIYVFFKLLTLLLDFFTHSRRRDLLKVPNNIRGRLNWVPFSLKIT